MKLAVAFAIGAVTAVLAMIVFQPRDRAPQGEPAPGQPRVAAAAAAVPAAAKPAMPAERKEWPSVQAGTKSKATLWTKSSEGTVLYRLLVTDLPESGLGFGPSARLVIKLLDADGFAVAEVEVDARESTRQHGPEGNVVSYEWLGAAAVPAETYALVRQWSLSWSGISDLAVPPAAGAPAGTATVAPAPAAATPAAVPAVEPGRAPRWKDRANWRKVTPGMPPQQVLLTLGVPSRKESNQGMETWHYGDLESGGYVFFVVSNGQLVVKSVTAPRG